MKLVKVFLIFVCVLFASGITLAYASDTQQDCGDEWHWVITGIKPTPSESSVPLSIKIVWDNQTSTIVELDKVSGSVAHYNSYDHLNDGIEPKSWHMIWKESYGTYERFNLSHGPCESEQNSTTSSTTTSTTIVNSTTTTIEVVDTGTPPTISTTTENVDQEPPISIPEDFELPKTGSKAIPIASFALLLVIVGFFLRRPLK